MQITSCKVIQFTNLLINCICELINQLTNELINQLTGRPVKSGYRIPYNVLRPIIFLKATILVFLHAAARTWIVSAYFLAWYKINHVGFCKPK